MVSSNGLSDGGRKGDRDRVGDGTLEDLHGDAPARQAVLQADLDDLRQRLDRERRRYQRHLLWVLAGASPGAFLPMLFVLSELGFAALAVVGVGVTTLEGWRAFRSKRAIRAMETAEMELRDRLDAVRGGLLP